MNATLRLPAAAIAALLAACTGTSVQYESAPELTTLVSKLTSQTHRRLLQR